MLFIVDTNGVPSVAASVQGAVGGPVAGELGTMIGIARPSQAGCSSPRWSGGGGLPIPGSRRGRFDWSTATACAPHQCADGSAVPGGQPGTTGIASVRVPPTDRSASRYTAEIQEISGRYGVSAALVEAVVRTESGFDPAAVSAKGAGA